MGGAIRCYTYFVYRLYIYIYIYIYRLYGVYRHATVTWGTRKSNDFEFLYTCCESLVCRLEFMKSFSTHTDFHFCAMINTEAFINHIRFWKPTQMLLDTILSMVEVICSDSPPTNNDISNAVQTTFPFATVSNASALRASCYR